MGSRAPTGATFLENAVKTKFTPVRNPASGRSDRPGSPGEGTPISSGIMRPQRGAGQRRAWGIGVGQSGEV